MRLSPDTPDRIDDRLVERVFDALDARLTFHDPAALAVAFSGGGDSLALLDLAVSWGRARGRRVLALTVDHGLNPESGAWTRRARDQALAFGADWRGLHWCGTKPTSGLPAAARAARHALLADAAREEGACVVLTGHTADDRAEEAMMRASGSTLGRLRDWRPSPAWPEGRGLMLFSPLLEQRREALRRHLSARGLDWLDDPANDDLRFTRALARKALGPLAEVEGLSLVVPNEPGVEAALSSGERDAFGIITLPRVFSLRTLSLALTCVSGGAQPARGRRLMALHGRISGEGSFTATLGGARVTIDATGVRVCRDPGRQGLPRAALTAGQPLVWDGRFEVVADRPGLSVGPAAGWRASLADADLAVLRTLPREARGVMPVLFGDGLERPVLAWRHAEVRCLVSRRFALATDEMSHEREIAAPMDGEIPLSHLCLHLRGEFHRPRPGVR